MGARRVPGVVTLAVGDTYMVLYDDGGIEQLKLGRVRRRPRSRAPSPEPCGECVAVP